MEHILRINNLTVEFMTVRGIVYAVQGASLSLKQGEVLGIVGESGCGKSVMVKSILRLHREKHTRYGGQILIEGRDVLRLTQKEMGIVRGTDAGMVFQDPMISLNPIIKIGEQIAETLRIRKSMSKRLAYDESLRLLRQVGITPPEDRYLQYPFELSGGMLQRVMIAMAIALRPKILIADEATTALDVTIQAEILALLKRLRAERGMSLIVVTHDFGVVAEMCDSVCVMYAGEIVESGSVERIFASPAHPYTKALIDSVPRPGTHGDKLSSIPGMPPDLLSVHTGCAFYPRCSVAEKCCETERPELHSAGGAHIVRCERPIWKK
ncbi:MAG: ABC transporter ATP-binding protein [Clostridiales Family XIII bacterium]|jgi:oligopeptide/dipeptide ABC transporter ATP-binding protein|nr:ABC transporter ATP-binding protein [Clostridiales Family XIII bacterium]